MSRLVPPHLFWAAVVVAAVLPAAFTRDPALDWDTWWHAAVGRWVAEHHALPAADPFSRLGREAATPWVAYSWLYELAVYVALDRFGPAGVLTLRSMLVAGSTAAVLWLAVGRSPRTVSTVLVTLLAGVVLMPLAKERPWHLSIGFTAVVVAAVERLRAGESVRRAWWLLPLFAAWANLHVQFVLGWLVLGLACLFPGSADRRRLLALTAGCVLATLANPYHVRLWGVVAEYATQHAGRSLVDELAPLDPRGVWFWAAVGLFALGVRAAVRRPDWAFPLALLGVGLMLALSMRRDVWVVAVAAAGTRSVSDGVERPTPSLRVHFAVFATAIVVRFVGPAGDVDAANAAKFPVRAAAVVREREPPGPLFNPFDWGGYLIWALPDHPVAIDGRTNLYGDARLRRSFATWAADGWETDPDLAASNLVIGPPDSPLVVALKARPGWAVVYADRTAAVLSRR
jgi:hypothetical protein